MNFEFDKEIDSLLRQTAKGEDLFTVTNPPAEHIDADEISMFAENALPAKARPRVMKHLADCDRCRTILSNVIALNAEDEESAGAAVPVQETKVETVVASTEPGWFEKLFSTRNLAFGMGALALIFAVGIGFIAIQNTLQTGESSIAQANTATYDKQSSPEAAKESPGDDGTAANSNVGLDSDVASKESNDTGQTDSPTELSDNNAPVADSDRKEADGVSAKAKATPAAGRQDLKNEKLKKKAPVSEDKDASDDFEKKVEEETTTEEKADQPKPANDPAPAASKPAPPIVRRGQARTTTLNSGENKKTGNAGKGAVDLTTSGRRQLGGKTFSQKKGIWTDSAYKGQKTTNIKRNTNDYKKLDSGLRSITDKLKGTVIVVWKSKAYKVQ